MSQTFNLLDQAWIPCTLKNGQYTELSLSETLLRATEITRLGGNSPLAIASLHRITLAVLHSALRGPSGWAEWKKIWLAGSFDQPWLTTYLGKWHNRFDLFDPVHPFFQADEANQKLKPISNLIPEFVSGNNAVLFDHHTDDMHIEVPAAQAARLLVTAQSFGLAGTFDPPRLTHTDAPWGRGVIFLLEGDNLFETLTLNLIAYNPKHEQPIVSTKSDCPAWEQETPFRTSRSQLNGYLDYLTWQNRWVRLLPVDDQTTRVAEIKIFPGLRLPEECLKNKNYLDPQKHYRIDEKSGFYLTQRFLEERSIWRDSPAWFQVKTPRNTRPPLNFTWARQLSDPLTGGVLPPSSRLRFMALGMASNQSKIEFFSQANLPLPLVYLQDEDLLGCLSASLELAEQVHRALKFSGSWLAMLIQDRKTDGMRWQEIGKPSRDQAERTYAYWGVERDYWSKLELPFYRLLEEMPNKELQAIAGWQAELRKAAWEALEKAIALAGDSPSALKAATRARSLLGGRLFQLIQNSIEQTQP